MNIFKNSSWIIEYAIVDDIALFQVSYFIDIFLLSELHFHVVTVILLHDQDAVMGGAQQAGGFFKSFF